MILLITYKKKLLLQLTVTSCRVTVTEFIIYSDENNVINIDFRTN